MNAIAMTLLMIASALAGCTSGDPDGDGTSGIDMEILNEMIDDNLQDFINNTSVTVYQEIHHHYHNNTTVVNNYDETNNEFSNTTNVEGEEVNNFYEQNDYSSSNYSIGNGSGESSIVKVMRVQQNYTHDGDIINYNELDFIIDGVLQFPNIDNVAVNMSYNTNDGIYEFDFTCAEFRNARYMDGYYWYEWARFGELNSSDPWAWDLSYQIENDIYNLETEYDTYCGDGMVYGHFEIISLDIAEGEALSFIEWTSSDWIGKLNCLDGFEWNFSGYDVRDGELIGGWSDCTLTLLSSYQMYNNWDSFEIEDSQNNTGGTEINLPSWASYSDNEAWAYWVELTVPTPGEDVGSNSFDGIFYYTQYFVVPVE